MQSLRKTQAPAPGTRLRKGTIKADRDARKSRVGDKIKKRMSTMRYADISAPTNIPDVPSLPTRALRPTPDAEDIYDHRRSEPRASTSLVDLDVLQHTDFDPDAYLKSKMAHSTEAELKTLQSSLEAAKDDASKDLQRNVFQNYEEFVLISKEISTLENDMLELKEGLSEWKSIPALLSIEESVSSSTDRRRANRSSVADLAKLYATQISNLHMTIEGSSKFVPAIPGRHIVLEVENSWSLNSATYKVEYAVHFVLLDDSLLVAKRRKRRTGEGGKLVAERCWPLNEISLLDVKDSQDVTRAFRVRRGKESFAYRCEKTSDKRAFLASFKVTSEELAAKKRKEREGEHERRRSLWNVGDRMSMFGGADIPNVPSLPSYLAPQAGTSTEKAEQDQKWTEDFSDELTVAIALQRWDEAVGLVEKGQSRLATTPPLGPILTALTASLTSSLLHALSDTTLRKTGVISLITLLLRLKEGNAARDAFLLARGELVRKRTRMIGFEGETSAYISELSLVVFTSIKHTADWFLASFKENDMSSGLIQWVKDQLEIFARMFRRQVYGTQVDVRDVEDSLEIMRSQSKKLLQDNGLNFVYLLEQLVQPPSELTKPQGRLSTLKPKSALSITVNAPPSSQSVDLATPSPTPTPTLPSRPSTPRILKTSTPSTPSSPSSSAAVPRPRPPRSALPPRSPRVIPPPRSRDRPSSNTNLHASMSSNGN